MATIQDIGVSAAINILGAIVFLLAFAFLRLQPFNDRVYFPKWYLKGSRESKSWGYICSEVCQFGHAVILEVLKLDACRSQNARG
jgi:hypothetical protein